MIVSIVLHRVGFLAKSILLRIELNIVQFELILITIESILETHTTDFESTNLKQMAYHRIYHTSEEVNLPYLSNQASPLSPFSGGR